MTGTYTLHTDGGARGNPGPAGIGAVLTDPDGEVVHEIAKGIGWTTNNVAEYTGLIEGLKAAIEQGVADLDVFMDSTLVIQQMKGVYRVKHPGLKPLHAQARQLAGRIGRVRYRAIPRAQNKHADRLSNEGMDAWEEANPGFEPEAPNQPELF